MQYIDKSKEPDKLEAHRLILDFVQSAWNADVVKYVGLSYDSLKRDCPSLVKLLVDEQDRYCCYCMRRISETTSTLEHVIPQKCNAEDLHKYRIYGQLNSANVSVSEELSAQLTPPPFPHFIAYENLVASCKGSLFRKSNNEKIEQLKSQCCNNKRGNDFIIPLFFLENISTLISYSKDGTIVYGEEYHDTISKTNLSDEILSLFRKTWYLVSKEYEIINVIDSIQNKELRTEILDCCIGFDTSNNHEMFSKNDYLWELFSEFEWFHSYYMGVD